MAKSDTITIEIQTNVDIDKLRADIRNNAVMRGIDDSFKESVEQLKNQLMFFLKNPQIQLDEIAKEEAKFRAQLEGITVERQQLAELDATSGDITKTIGTNVVSDVTKTSGVSVSTGTISTFNRPSKSMPIADAIIVNAISEANLKEKDVQIRNGKKIDSSAVVVLQKKGSEASRNTPPLYRGTSGVGKSFESLFREAVETFNEAIIAINDGNGNVEYFFNPGLSLEPFVKIHCSRSTDKKLQEDRFRTYPDLDNLYWQLLSEPKNTGANLEAFVRQNFININSVMEKLKNADTEGAIEETRTVQRSVNTSNISSTSKITKNTQDVSLKRVNSDFVETMENNIRVLEEKRKNIPSYDLYLKLVDSVKNLKDHKKLKKNGAEYSVQISGIKFPEDFTADLQRAYSLWKLKNSKVWVQAMHEAINKVLNINSGGPTKKVLAGSSPGIVPITE